MHNVIPLLEQLVAIDSVNPELVAGGAGEAAIAHFIADWLRAAGLEVIVDEVRPGRPNVIGLARGTGGGRTLMLNGHTDTVGVAGMTAPHRPQTANGRMYGRGAYDMKAGLAACMVAAAEAKQRNLAGDVLITAVMDEEFGGKGTIAVAEKYRADAAIIAEPTELQLVIAHRGSLWLEIETHGKAAHGSMPHLGVDAIAKMGRVLVEIEKLGERLLANPTHPLLKSGSLHASLITGGQELSSYPQSCVLSIERRTIPGETPESCSAEFQQILDSIAADDPAFRASLRPGFFLPPMETSADSPIARLIMQQCNAVVGQPPAIVGVPYWTDAASLAQAGIPALLFGPSGTGAHAVEEWVDIKSVEQCVQIFLQTAVEFCR